MEQEGTHTVVIPSDIKPLISVKYQESTPWKYWGVDGEKYARRFYYHTKRRIYSAKES